MIDLFEKGVELANHYGISLLLILVIVFGLRIVLSSTEKWSEREHYYYELLKNLGIWKNSLSDRLDYFQQSDSEYDELHTKTTHFQEKSAKAILALQSIREQINVSRIFLSKQSIHIIDELISEHWFIKEHEAINTSDYLRSTYEIVDNAYQSILADASKDLRRSRFLAIIKKVLSKD
ncbi:hypothetical protein [Pedobacter gandavensis]|uniref:hypothetical protein n=1 Tax=Pedobacter gandavensis TaxID=2679963 RepID=UPI00292E511F|nr:hypothetical protein [Pedobacter gandavensis]